MKSVKLIGKYRRKVTAQSLSMYTGFLKRFGENLKKMFPRILFHTTFSNSNGSSTDVAWGLYCIGIRPNGTPYAMTIFSKKQILTG